MIDLERFREGDRSYLEELVRTQGHVAMRVARAYGRDPDHVDDLFQEIWMHVFQKRDTYRGLGSFQGWIHRVATHVCATEYRLWKTQRRDEAVVRRGERFRLEEERSRDPLDEMEARERRRKLHRAFGELTDREHEALYLRILEERRPREVAAIMGVKSSTIRSIIRHGIKRLKKLMEAEGDEMPRHP